MTTKQFASWAVGLFIVAFAAALGMQSFGEQIFGATSIFAVFQGGTGTSSPSGVLYGSGSATALQTVTIGSNLTFSGGTLSASGSSFPTSTNPLMASYFVATSTTASNFPYASTTAWSITSTSTGSRGINLSGGCFAINGTCLTSGGSGNTTSVSTLGYNLQCFAPAQVNPADATNYIWCGQTASGVTGFQTSNRYPLVSITVPKTGVITSIYNDFHIVSTLASSEIATSSISINGLSTTTVATTTFTTDTTRTSNTNMYVPVTAGDLIYLLLQTPTWSTNPTGVVTTASIYIQATTTVSVP